ncbi:hypothetical protein DDZ13_15160 [Coraliomargarita sinensis]|uniref:Uncharacterized protein n=1 Tax=Coraliomargarita sinensis TaxID=2174842 RepID=A0A317ZF74_9BACT|nr:hypothetical protein DDZ13_15160 [Coraliomargarita sinensis]
MLQGGVWVLDMRNAGRLPELRKLLLIVLKCDVEQEGLWSRREAHAGTFRLHGLEQVRTGHPFNHLPFSFAIHHNLGKLNLITLIAFFRRFERRMRLNV